MQSLEVTVSAIRTSTRAEELTASALEHAIFEGQLALHYQPVVNLVDETVTGFEALVRWEHPELGLVCASAFIALAEGESSLMRALDDWVLEAACRQLAAWQDDVLVTPGFRVAVNLSARELDGDRILERVEGSVERSGVDTNGLVIEVTESVALESREVARQTAKSLHEMGIQLAIDDFGMRYSGVSRLHSLPFDILKIDREFVQETHTESGTACVSAIVALGNSLGLRIIAEGIETPEQAHDARVLGCHEGQGFLWSPAMSGQLATRLLTGSASMDDESESSPWWPRITIGRETRLPSR
jgi:EAL domain-containing protein (putative c-di-GMP-specific phosphodiesterase class I)